MTHNLYVAESKSASVYWYLSCKKKVWVLLRASTEATWITAPKVSREAVNINDSYHPPPGLLFFSLLQRKKNYPSLSKGKVWLARILRSQLYLSFNKYITYSIRSQVIEFGVSLNWVRQQTPSVGYCQKLVLLRTHFIWPSGESVTKKGNVKTVSSIYHLPLILLTMLQKISSLCWLMTFQQKRAFTSDQHCWNCIKPLIITWFKWLWLVCQQTRLFSFSHSVIEPMLNVFAE